MSNYDINNKTSSSTKTRINTNMIHIFADIKYLLVRVYFHAILS